MIDFETDDNGKTFAELLEGTIKGINSGSVVQGTIIGYNDTEVSVGLGFKYDGAVPIAEFTSIPGFDAETDLKTGSLIDVFVVRVDDKEGKIQLSKKKVDFMKDFRIAEKAYNDRVPLEVTVTKEVKGGVIARTGAFDIFIPASQVSDRYMKEFSQFIGKKMLIKLIEYNEEKRRFVGSARVLQAENRKNSEEKIFSEIEIGKVYKGTVKSMTDFGVFVDIGGIEGLVHISELSWSKIRHPSQVVHLGDEIEVFVLNFDLERKRISLGYKRTEDNPWTNIEERYPTGAVVKGRVARIVPFGAFIELERGVDGLVHISCVSNRRINRVEEVLTIGEEIEAKVIESNPVEMRISLSIKALLPPEEPKAWVKTDYNSAARAKPENEPETETIPTVTEAIPQTEPIEPTVTAFEAALEKAAESAETIAPTEVEVPAETVILTADETTDIIAEKIKEEPPELVKKAPKPRAKRTPKIEVNDAESVENEEAKPEA